MHMSFFISDYGEPQEYKRLKNAAVMGVEKHHSCRGIIDDNDSMLSGSGKILRSSTPSSTDPVVLPVHSGHGVALADIVMTTKQYAQNICC